MEMIDCLDNILQCRDDDKTDERDTHVVCDVPVVKDISRIKEMSFEIKENRRITREKNGWLLTGEDFSSQWESKDNMITFVDFNGGPFVSVGQKLSQLVPELPEELDGIISKIRMTDSRRGCMLFLSPMEKNELVLFSYKV